MNKSVKILMRKLEEINLKRLAKVSAVTLVSLSLVGGSSAYADDIFEDKARAEQVNLLINQAKSENITLKNQDEIKKIVAESIGKDLNSIRFEKIELFDTYATDQAGVRYYNEDRYDDDNDGDDRDYITLPSDSSNNGNNQSKEYIYKVDADVNFIEYKLTIDAKTGKVLTSRVDN
ncbi:MAG: hypothetical protein Q3988_03025 [Gemella sp.]|nr:hypothetical protein [Gemella sp.]